MSTPVMGWFAYLSDNGNVYRNWLKIADANEGGFAGTDDHSFPARPIGMEMRHVDGVDGDGNRASLYIALPSDSKYVVKGQSFSLNTKTYAIQGRIGERRTFRSD